ncbi:glucosamine inositolphosphorylceramide transferase family protein [Tessaracoccus caeni]|uniref:glucosamine inositolphosphorylceramide transferase family protein n=1 Tax=Tessaracoccus caeni TaxID=3031239 RepID=UPI0023DAE6F9|nr:hypothetical protein [Tessaracoccus caeni]MDF1487566.1 hypothetical protein [Tessaracoccus caeni]
MHLEVRIGSRSQRRWHEELITRLRALPDTEVSVRIVTEEPTKERKQLERLLTLERRLHGLAKGLLAPASLSSPTSRSEAESTPDIVLDLTSTPAQGTWRLLYDGRSGHDAAADALRGGRFPLVSVVDDSGAVRAAGRPGSELPGLLSTALADLHAGSVTLIVGAVSGSPFVTPADADEKPASPRPFAQIAARRVVGAAIRLAYRMLYRAPHWRVGWRRLDGPDVLDLGELPKSGWEDLDDDGYRFFADPFPFAHQGRTYLFVEDFDHRTGKGVISVSEWDENGPKGLPTPVLTHEVHLSYPFVLEHDGEIWMIPETSGARRVELHRATRFPWDWERHSILLDDVEASDVTVFTNDGRWWMMATVGFGGSLSDSLCIWSAPDLTGPWTPHAHNPVLVDIASARPAGHVVNKNGTLLRPVQDGRTGYGAALGIAEITKLDDDGFDQRIVRHHTSGERWPGTRLHTLNVGGDIETIDGSRLVPRFWRSRG